jgi:hypothetical protein
MKPGYKSTEFWVTLTGQLVGVLLLTGVVSPDQSEVLGIAAGKAGGIANELIGVVTMVGSAFGYNLSRGLAKKEVPNTAQ